jgi:hypothetical protein
MVDGENGGVIDALIYESASLRMPNSTQRGAAHPIPQGRGCGAKLGGYSTE